ncbi:tetratricopeptide repeat protein, partial [Arthrospira platensis SPKY1]|nr:tetratricopeptide repeat protein [Arthrospira platensis SPKY1]
MADLYRRVELFEEAEEMAMKLYSVAPTADNVLRVAKLEFDRGEYRDAIKYYEEAAGKTEDSNVLKDIHMKLAESYKNTDNFQKARGSAQAAMKIDPNWGQPYLMISEIYAAAVSNCSGGEVSREDKAVYWLVLD